MKKILLFLLMLTLFLVGCAPNEEDAQAPTFSEGKPIELVEVTPSEQEEIEKPFLEKESALMEKEKEIVATLKEEERDGLHLVFADEKFTVFLNFSTNQVMKFDSDENLTELFSMEEGQELYSRADGGKYYLATGSHLYAFGSDGELKEKTDMPDGFPIREISDEGVVLQGKDKVHYYSMDKGEIDFAVDGDYVGIMESYLVVKVGEELHFIDPKAMTISKVESPSSLHPLTSSSSSLLVIPKEGGITYYKIR